MLRKPALKEKQRSKDLWHPPGCLPAPTQLRIHQVAAIVLVRLVQLAVRRLFVHVAHESKSVEQVWEVVRQNHSGKLRRQFRNRWYCLNLIPHR